MYNYGGNYQTCGCQSYPTYQTCGNQGYQTGGGYGNKGIGGIGLIIVLFILLVIVGATFCN